MGTEAFRMVASAEHGETVESVRRTLRPLFLRFRFHQLGGGTARSESSKVKD